MKKSILLSALPLAIALCGCTDDGDSNPLITVKSITIDGQQANGGMVGVGDSVKIALELRSTKKGINSFSAKLKGASNYFLEISDYDEVNSGIQGNEVATNPDVDCTLTFKDNIFESQITLTTVLKEFDEQGKPLLSLYLTSENDVDVKDLELDVVSE